MKVEEFWEYCRWRNDPIRVDSVKIDTGKETHTAHGTLQVEKGQFHFRLAVDSGKLELPPCGTFTPDMFWRISGLIDDEVFFVTESLPHKVEQGVIGGDFNRAYFHSGQISLLREQTSEEEEELRQWSEQIRKNWLGRTSDIDTTATQEQQDRDTVGHVRAILTDYKLVWHNGSSKTTHSSPFGDSIETSTLDTLQGELEDYKFALQQAKTDLKVYLCSKDGVAVTPERLEEISIAFFHALAFVCGQDAWPQLKRIRHRGKTFKHVVTPSRGRGPSHYPLLNETACANGADACLGLEKASSFFLNSPLADNVTTLMYLARSAGHHSTPLEVGTLALCSIFEGLIDLLHREYCTKESSEDRTAFELAKTTLSDISKKHQEGVESHVAEAFQRISALISSAKFDRIVEKLKCLVQYFSLPWDGCFAESFNAWKSERNPLAHGRLGNRGSNGALETQSLIAGGINLLVAAAMGYHGLVVFSMTDDRYIRLPPRNSKE